MANDKNGAQLFVGDEVVLRAKVVDVNADHVLTRTVEPPHRELFFQAATVERTAQGAASIAFDKLPPAVAELPPAPAVATAVDKRAAAVAYLVTKGYSPEGAATLVDEQGYANVLQDQADEAAAAAEAAKAAAPTTTAAPAPATPALTDTAKPAA